jgi:hypothetical protein
MGVGVFQWFLEMLTTSLGEKTTTGTTQHSFKDSPTELLF